MREKPHIFEADVICDGSIARPDVLLCCPALERLLSSEADLRRRLNAARPELALDRLEQAKVQVNVGCPDGSPGGAFPFHFDLPSGKAARRHLTALLYLNPDWQEGDGGEVELLPFPFPDVAVPPTHNRLVVFSATTTMHRVRRYTGRASRVCVNLWFDGNVTMPFPTPVLSDQYDAKVARIVGVLRRQPQELRAFCKIWYKETIASSFREAFRPCDELIAALALHYEEAAEVESRIAPSTLKALRECLPLEPCCVEAEEDLVGLFEDL